MSTPFAAEPQLDSRNKDSGRGVGDLLRSKELIIEQLNLLFPGIYFSVLSNAVLAVAVAFFLQPVSDPVRLYGWLVLFGVMLLLRGLLGLAWHRHAASAAADARRWLQHFRLGVLSTSACWAVGVSLLFPTGNLALQELLAFSLAALCAGATVNLAVDRRSVLCYLIPALLPLLGFLLLEENSTSKVMGVLGFPLLLVLASLAVRSERLLHSNVKLRLNADARERELRESEVRFRALSEAVFGGIAMHEQGIILECNQGMADLTGYSYSELIGMQGFGLIAPESIDTVLANVRNGYEQAYDVTGLRKDGSRYPLSIRGKQTVYQGRSVRVIEFQDITQRKQAEAAQQQQLRFSIALNRIAQSVVEQDDSVKLLELIVQTISEALETDRALIYDISFSQQLAIGLAEWLNPARPDVTPTKATYPLSTFIGGASEIRRTRNWLSSQRDQVNPSMVQDGSGEILHRQMNIQSLLWYPFAFREDGYHLLTLNWIHIGKTCSEADIGFLDSVSQLVNVALAKIHLQTRLRLAASVFTHAREGILITDRHAHIIEVNQAFTDITGYGHEELLGKNPRIFQSGRNDKAFYTAMWQDLLGKDHWYGEIWNRRKDGSVYPVMLTISAVRDAFGEVLHYIALCSDITALKEHQAQLERIAHFDALTGLPNRLLLADRLQQALHQATRRGDSLAVVYLDLDGFKRVNDTHGHEVGDRVLITLAKRMTDALREGDTLSRIGGDEFVAVLVDLPDAQSSIPVLQRLLQAAAQLMQVQDLTLQVSASIGVSFYPQADDVDADQLVRQADQAMYQAKQSGKNRFHIFDAVQDRNIRGHHESLEHIRRALAQREFVLYYQPKVNMKTGALLGTEALIRWQHPERGLLAPAVFLPVIEEHPLAIELGEWVIETALTQMEAWHAQGLAIAVSVNVGALQLQHPEFVTRLRESMARHPGVQAGELELEVLETSALEDFAGVTQVIHACQGMGVGFALDDFGTGYSSLTYLKQLPATLLKIDQSFVRDMLGDPDDLAILDGVLGLAAAFRRAVIAEGVETPDHAEMLLRMGCTWGQGYAIARPMPAPELPRWVETWKSPPAWQAIEPLPRHHLPALFAAADHRAWIKGLLAYLSGSRDMSPELDAHQCRFGHWLDQGGRAEFLADQTHHPLDTLHRDVHRLGAELVALKQTGRTDEARARSVELLQLSDLLLKQLNGLYQRVGPR